ncbi:unnamed protein product, partial [Mesorhabditis belari]|uniref:3'-5' exonuclease domain-containing protein n=1 Tax=Mesorhabditis belari TaxID=2138241 RepID=A0AAF3FBX6_9BILA
MIVANIIATFYYDYESESLINPLVLNEWSPAYLVDSLCQVQLNKEFQTTDWRVRPLPEEMMHYAREDTHYLLYCYDLLRERLFQSGNERTNNLLEDVYRDSKEI